MNLRPILALLLLLGMYNAHAQDTLNFAYSKSVVNANPGNLFTQGQTKYFYSQSKKVSGNWVHFIEHDTIQYELRLPGAYRKLFRKEEYITNIEHIILLIGDVEYRYTINNTKYVLKKVKGGWACFSGEERIATFRFFKKHKEQIVQLITKDQSTLSEHWLVTSLYCANDLIKNKTTRFGDMMRTQAIMGLLR